MNTHISSTAGYRIAIDVGAPSPVSGAGDVIGMRSGRGGGWRDPASRDPEQGTGEPCRMVFDCLTNDNRCVLFSYNETSTSLKRRMVNRCNMSIVKERMTELIQAQPEDSSFDEILRELAFEQMIARGIEDSREGRTISNEEMKRRISAWQK